MGRPVGCLPEGVHQLQHVIGQFTAGSMRPPRAKSIGHVGHPDPATDLDAVRQRHFLPVVLSGTPESDRAVESVRIGHAERTFRTIDFDPRQIVTPDIEAGDHRTDGAASEIGPLAATTSLRDPSFYETNLSVDREGTWVLTIGVAGELGEAYADFAVEVRQAAPLVGITSFLALIILLAIVGLSVRAYFQERRPGSG